MIATFNDHILLICVSCSVVTGPFIYFLYCYWLSLIHALSWISHSSQISLFPSPFSWLIICCRQGSHSDRSFQPPLLPYPLMPGPRSQISAAYEYKTSRRRRKKEEADCWNPSRKSKLTVKNQNKGITILCFRVWYVCYKCLLREVCFRKKSWQWRRLNK